LGEADLNFLVGKRIKELRVLKEISQIELAEKCGFERTNMSRIESGRTNPTLSTLYKISQALGVSLDELVKVG